jgi:hypothetical protein
MASRRPIRKHIRELKGGTGFNPSLVGNGERGLLYPVIGEDESNVVPVTTCLAVLAIAATLIVATIFLGIHVFHNHHGHHHDTTLSQESLINDSRYEIVSEDFGSCLNGVEITLYRLVRTGDLVDVYVQGFCRNTSGLGTEMDIDLSFENFPDNVRCPTGSSDNDANVMGVGTAIVSGTNISGVVQIEANTDEDEIDLDFEFTGVVSDGQDVEFAIHANYDAGRCS